MGDMAAVQCSLRDTRGQPWPLHGKAVIGRDPQCDIVISGPSVSRRHASVSLGSQGVIVHDLHSANGTFVNDRRITTPAQLRNGDRLRVGQEVLVLQVEPQRALAHRPHDALVVAPTARAPRSLKSGGSRTLVPVLALAALGAIGVVALIALVGDRASGPDGAARTWMRALASQDVSRLSESTCLAQQNSAQATALVVGLGGLVGSSLEVDKLEYRTVRSDAETADVQVSGPLKLSFGPLATARRLNLNVKMRYESGQWRYCDDPQRVAQQL